MNPVSPAQKSDGFKRAPTPGKCCLCGKRVHRGQLIRRMPDNWNPASTRRHAHATCVRGYVRELARAAGQKISLKVPDGYHDPGPSLRRSEVKATNAKKRAVSS